MFGIIVDFLNWSLISIDHVIDFRMFHVIIISVCTYCIVDELKSLKGNK